MQIKMTNKRMLDQIDTDAEVLIYKLTQMVRELDDEAKKQGVILQWPRVQIETEDRWGSTELRITVRNYA